jgi:hypothetical protein
MGVEAQSRHERGDGTDHSEQLERRIPAISDHNQSSLRDPAIDLANQLERPGRNWLVTTVALARRAFGRRERGEKGQRPHATGPGNRR